MASAQAIAASNIALWATPRPARATVPMTIAQPRYSTNSSRIGWPRGMKRLSSASRISVVIGISRAMAPPSARERE